jgi:hypothetical protein
MGKVRVGISCPLNDGYVIVVIQRLERCHVRMKGDVSIELKNFTLAKRE